PAEIYTALESTALDMATPGYDGQTGYGLIQAPAAVLAVGSGLTVRLTAMSQAGDGNPDAFRLIRNGADLEFYLNGTVVVRGRSSSIDSIIIIGSTDGGSLTVDYSGGAIPQAITWDGGLGAANSLVLQGGSFFKEEYEVLDPHLGQLTQDGATIQF